MENKTKAIQVKDMVPDLNLLIKEQEVESLATYHKPIRFRSIQLGDLELTILSDGFMKLSPVEFFIKGISATPEAVKSSLQENFRDTDNWDLSINVMVVKSKDRLMLLDTGTGIFAEPSQGWLMESLIETGFDPSNFTDIIISHVHSDHIGGLIDSNKNLIFPNASIHIAEIEHEFWRDAITEDFKNSPLYEMKDFLKKIIADNQEVLKVIQSKIKFMDFEKGLYGIFAFELAPGHTPGHTVTIITSKNEKLIWAADLFHSDVLLLTHPEWGFLADTNIQQAVDSRIEWLQYIADNKLKTFAYHVPYPGLGHIRKKGNHFEWVPQVFATP